MIGSPGGGDRHAPVIGLNSLTDPKTWSKALWRSPFHKWRSWSNRVDAILANPCSPTPDLWVLAAWDALPTLILSPIKPSTIDYLIIRAGKKHSGKGRKIFDVWDFEQLLPLEDTSPRWVRFLALGIGARSLWYFALVDATLKFAVRWISLTYQYAGCQYDGEGFCQMSQPGTVVLVGPLQNAQVTLWEVDGEDIFVGGPTSIDVPIGFDPSVTAIVTAVPWSVAPDQFKNPTFRVVDNSTGHTVATSQSLKQPGGGTEQTMVFLGRGQGTLGHEYSVHVDMEAGYALIANGHFNAFGTPKKDAILPDP